MLLEEHASDRTTRGTHDMTHLAIGILVLY